MLRPLFEIQVAHAYFGDAPCDGLRLVPSAACAARLANARCLARTTPRGIEVWRDDDADAVLALLAAAPGGPPAFVFLGRSRDPLYANYTEALPRGDEALPCYTSRSAVAEDDGVLRLHDAAHADASAARLPLDAPAVVAMLTTDERRAAPGFAISIVLPPPDAPPPRYRLRLQARATYWKYLLVGPWSDAPDSLLSVAEPADTAAADDGTAFTVPAPETLVDGSAAFAIRSVAPLRLAHRPQRRLQLRSSGPGAPAVLLKRLPEPDARHFASALIDGRPSLVSEIFLHR